MANSLLFTRTANSLSFSGSRQSLVHSWPTVWGSLGACSLLFTLLGMETQDRKRCQYCQKSFAHSSSLSKHIRKEHHDAHSAINPFLATSALKGKLHSLAVSRHEMIIILCSLQFPHCMHIDLASQHPLSAFVFVIYLPVVSNSLSLLVWNTEPRLYFASRLTLTLDGMHLNKCTHYLTRTPGYCFNCLVA